MSQRKFRGHAYARSFMGAAALAVCLPACSGASEHALEGEGDGNDDTMTAEPAPSGSVATPAPSALPSAEPAPTSSAVGTPPAPTSTGTYSELRPGSRGRPVTHDGGSPPGDGAPPGDAGKETGDADPVVPPPKWNAAPCSADPECESGHCIDGLCCDTACTGQFEACDQARYEGVCTATTTAFVDPALGNDTSDGTEAHPLKTLTAALHAARPNWTIWLKTGTYDAASGEKWPVTVPDRVTVQVPEGNVATLAGGSDVEGVVFVESGALSGVVFRGFKTAVRANRGVVALLGVDSAFGGGFAFDESVVATVANTTMGNVQGTGIDASGSAEVTLTAVRLASSAAQCSDVLGIRARGSARVHASQMELMRLPSSAIDAGDEASVDVTNSNVVSTGKPKHCGAPGSQVSVRGSAHIELNGTAVLMSNGYGAFVTEHGELVASNSTFRMQPEVAIEATGGKVILNSSVIDRTGDDFQRGIAIHARDTAVSLDATTLATHYSAVDLSGASSLRMRNTKTADCRFGIMVGTSTPVTLDLGTAESPGNNAITSTDHALTYLGQFASPTILEAVGNTWNDTSSTFNGVYPRQVFAGPLDDRNFYVVAPNSLRL